MARPQAVATRADASGPRRDSHGPRRRWLPAATALAIALGGGLRFPVLQTTFFSDDYMQLAMLRGRFLFSRAPWDLFWFGPRTQVERRALLEFGFDPWWTADQHTISMFRPLSSLLIWFDERVFGANAFAWHLHSLAWWVALVLCAARLSSRVLPDAVAACTVLLFALDASHTVPLAWLANRSTLVAATFGMLALLAHVRWRESGDGAARTPPGVTVLWWACALAAGEYAFGMLAYLIAYEAFGARDAPRKRLTALLPAGTLAAAYLGMRALLGYGAIASGIYVAPHEPLRFVGAAAARVPALAGDLLLGVPAGWWQGGSPARAALIELWPLSPESWSRLPAQRSVQIAIGVGALGLGLLALRYLARFNDRAGASRPRSAPQRADELRAARWLAAGSFLSLIAASGTVPSARLLVASAFGASALLACVLSSALAALRDPDVRGRLRVRARVGLVSAVLFVALVHGAFAAYDAYAETARLSRHARLAQTWALEAPIPRAASELDVVMISAGDFATAANLPWLRAAYGWPLPHSYQRLSAPMQAHDVKRIDAHTLEISVLTSDVDGLFAGSLYRPRTDWLHLGERVRGPGFEVSVLALEAGNPFRFRVRFDRDLDDPALLFLHARLDGLSRISLPAPGQSLRLPVAAVPWQRERDP